MKYTNEVFKGNIIEKTYEDTVFDNCCFEGVLFIGVEFKNCRFLNSTFEQCTFENCTITATRWTSCRLSEVDFEFTLVYHSNFDEDCKINENVLFMSGWDDNINNDIEEIFGNLQSQVNICK